jgi:hypothetical protein
MPLTGHNAGDTEISSLIKNTIFMDIQKIIQLKGKCCISGRSLIDCKYTNLVSLDFHCTWDYPYQSNLLIPGSPRRAQAIVHDDYVTTGMQHVLTEKVKYAVEFKGEQIIYHAVEDLQPIFYSTRN